MASESWLTRRLRDASPRRVTVPRSLAGNRQTHRPHLIVCGDDPLTHRLVDELVTRYDAAVTVILASRRRNHAPQIARLGVTIVEADRLDAAAFTQAGIGQAAALALVAQDDVGNIHAALQARELNPELRLVVRMFNRSLGNGIRQLFGTDCAILSDAFMAAPAFVAAALGEVSPVHLRLPGRTVYAARREEVAARDILCGLAATSPDGPAELLPLDPDRADLVLAVASGAKSAELERGAPLRTKLRIEWRRRNPFGALRVLVSPKLRTAALALLLLIVACTVVLSWLSPLSWYDAAYQTVLDALSGASPSEKSGPVQRLVEALLTLVSVALIPVLTAAVVEAVVNARLALELGRLKEPISDHVVVVGLGNVGTLVIRQLHDLGVRVVAIDSSDTARGAQIARQLSIPVIVGDAAREETLRAASVETCRALVVLSTDDVVNLQAALHGRNLHEDLRVVLRLFDGEFAGRLQKAFGITISRSVSYVAAPAFAAALLEREVIGTIPVGRKVLLVTEVPVCPGSTLDGAPASVAEGVGEARVIAMTRGAYTHWEWARNEHLRSGDALIAVATRAGLGRLLALSRPPLPVGPVPPDAPNGRTGGSRSPRTPPPAGSTDRPAGPADRPADRPAARPAARPADRSADRPAALPADRPAGKPSGGAEPAGEVPSGGG